MDSFGTEAPAARGTKPVRSGYPTRNMTSGFNGAGRDDNGDSNTSLRPPEPRMGKRIAGIGAAATGGRGRRAAEHRRD
ncbi:hypothetical protein D9X30_1363 [Cupriavidus sp. U2]|nr:hypothetical protein D9X30_1363 [Cupriavidus sp. U2]